MATYSNQHWLLCHIRNSFISTDDSGICETVMASNDLPKHFLQRYQNASQTNINLNSSKPNQSINSESKQQRTADVALQDVDFICYPGLDQSDDEDLDLTTQSFDIQMYPEVGAHRFRSNTAQKLEKMDIARRKAARTKCVNFDDEIVQPENPNEFFAKKAVGKLGAAKTEQKIQQTDNFGWPEKSAELIEKEAKQNLVKFEPANDENIKHNKSKLALQLTNSPKQVQNKFLEYARFDGTSQLGIQTKRINVFLAMLPERERNYPIKICVIASAKIIEVIGLVCYKATIQFPDLPLKSIRDYALYMTEDNDDLDDFPPLDNREPCSKFGFSHLTLAERRTQAADTRSDYHSNMHGSSKISEEDRARLAAAAVRVLQGIDLNGGNAASLNGNEDESSKKNSLANVQLNIEEDDSDDKSFSEYDRHMLCHNEVLEAPMYKTFRLNLLDKRFFKTEIILGISGERIDIDQQKNSKFWSKQKQVTFPIDAIAFCEIVERKHLKGIIRIWLRAQSSLRSTDGAELNSKSLLSSGSAVGTLHAATSPTSPGHYPANFSSPFAFLTGSTAAHSHASTHPPPHPNIRFKHYDFEADLPMAEQIKNKLNCILEVRSSEVRREFLQLREKKLEKSQAKKHLKL